MSQPRTPTMVQPPWIKKLSHASKTCESEGSACSRMNSGGLVNSSSSSNSFRKSTSDTQGLKYNPLHCLPYLLGGDGCWPISQHRSDDDIGKSRIFLDILPQAGQAGGFLLGSLRQHTQS